jgi:hypothetical protein
MKRPTDDDEPDDRPRRKKKGRSRSAAPNYWLWGGAAFGVLFLGLIVGVVLLVRLGPEKVAAPAQFSSYSPPEDQFQISLPQGGWKLDSGGKKNIGWVSAAKGSATIKAYESLTGSLLGDIAGAAQGGRNVGDDLLPVSQVHNFKKLSVAEEYTQYKEEAAVTVDSRFGKARRSVFTARDGLRTVRGYRATALGPFTQITVLCTCAPSDWDTLEPAFAKVIASVGPVGAAP